ncbi:MAG TPA: hypothetical protein VL027_06425 [Spongiibacteraceae bacterium]|jgi:Tfp pilus assembly protein PilF|nr:hypothetical protein [Spongiibacteraceae bacterium]HUH37562.1 hypothetical protein [Spongiibacteraceae bacterium]
MHSQLPVSWFALLVTLLLSATVSGEANTHSVNALKKRWAEVNYQLEGKARLAAFEQLVTDAENATADNPEMASAWIWSGIIKSSYAGAKGGLGALRLAKSAKSDLENALQLDPEAMDGSAYTTLGTLYVSVPGWPLGFGDDKKGVQLLRQALMLNPNGIDPNYFYADYLRKAKRYVEARDYLRKAQQASPRPDRPVADAGRQREISAALAAVEARLEH